MSDGIYEAVFHSSWRVRFTFDDSLYQAALGGHVKSRDAFIIRFLIATRARYDKPLEQYVRWDDRHFDHSRIGDAAQPKKKAAEKTVVPPSGECDCECSRCDIGYHCHNPRSSCNLRP